MGENFHDFAFNPQKLTTLIEAVLFSFQLTSYSYYILAIAIKNSHIISESSKSQKFSPLEMHSLATC